MVIGFYSCVVFLSHYLFYVFREFSNKNKYKVKETRSSDMQVLTGQSEFNSHCLLYIYNQRLCSIYLSTNNVQHSSTQFSGSIKINNMCKIIINYMSNI